MKSVRLYPSFLVAAALALLFLSAARAADQTSTITFSDPSKPGTLKLQIARGEIDIKGADVTEVSVKSDAQPAKQTPRKDGLRVLTATSGFTLVEKGNVITLDAMSDGWHGRGADYKITVPRNTNIIVSNSWGGGDIRCTDITGDIEIERMHGEVRLDGISGGAVVSTLNGEIQASVVKLNEKKPLSFTSMNGEVLLRLPPDAKANIRLRTQNGSILTDFEETVLQSKVENVSRTVTARSIRAGTAPSAVLPPEAKEAIREGARIAAEAAREAAAAMREAAAAAREGLEEGRAYEGPKPPAPPTPPAAPRPPKMPAVPTPTGGHVVSGTLNGGGPEINVSTMNGDVILRKLQQK